MDKCIASLESMGYADREKAEREAEAKRKAQLVVEQRKAAKEREQRQLVEKCARFLDDVVRSRGLSKWSKIQRGQT